jgi:AcrR family transcriptional regulator
MSIKIDKQPSPRGQKAIEQREKLLETALALFAEHGFEGTTIKELSERAGVSMGLMYHYFKNKESLLEAIVSKHSFIPRLRQAINEDNDHLPAGERFRKLIFDFYILLGEEKELMQIFLQEGRSNAVIQRVWRKTLSEGLTLIQGYLDGLIKKRIIKPHNTEVTARSFFSTVVVMRFTEDIWPTKVSPQKIISELVENMLYGIAQ